MKLRLPCFAMMCLLLAGACSQAADGRGGAGAVAVDSYEACVAAGNKILKSYPPQCVTADGARFFQGGGLLGRDGGAATGGCRDLCGDGSCQEVVCMAVGCPCPESEASCPKDCSAPGRP